MPRLNRWRRAATLDFAATTNERLLVVRFPPALASRYLDCRIGLNLRCTHPANMCKGLTEYTLMPYTL